jgi:hypothetical protein
VLLLPIDSNIYQIGHLAFSLLFGEETGHGKHLGLQKLLHFRVIFATVL